MKFVTVCMTYFKSLAMANLAAALYSVRRQDLEHVDSLILVDNDTGDSMRVIQELVDSFEFPMPTFVVSLKHNDPSLTHSWSTNKAVRLATAPWVFFTRADYLLDFTILEKFERVARVGLRAEWFEGFITSNGCHLNNDIGECEATAWRREGPRIFRGVEYDYTMIDTGVWMMPKALFDGVGGLDEGLTAWGHAQTHFQWKLRKAGVEFTRVPETLFFHPLHAAERDLALADRQLHDRGLEARDLWADYR